MYTLQFTKQQLMLQNKLRELWEEHGIWTRSFIISTVSKLGDMDAVTNRLLRNPTDFAILLRQFYNKKTADKFEELLRQHLLIAGQLVTAARDQDKEKADMARTAWYKNADDIAKFLSIINPYWSINTWQKMLYKHLELVENEAVLRLEDNYTEDIKNFDELENQSLAMADYMFEGIVRQFYL